MIYKTARSDPRKTPVAHVCTGLRRSPPIRALCQYFSLVNFTCFLSRRPDDCHTFHDHLRELISSRVLFFAQPYPVWAFDFRSRLRTGTRFCRSLAAVCARAGSSDEQTQPESDERVSPPPRLIRFDSTGRLAQAVGAGAGAAAAAAVPITATQRPYYSPAVPSPDEKVIKY